MKGRKERKSITDRDKDAIMALIRLGEDDETIAKFIGRSVIAIRTLRWNYDFLRKEWRFCKVK
mgnify:CR=1 FL=1